MTVLSTLLKLLKPISQPQVLVLLLIFISIFMFMRSQREKSPELDSSNLLEEE